MAEVLLSHHTHKCTSLIGDTPFTMTLFLTNGCLSNNGCHFGILSGYPGSAAGLSGHYVMWHNVVKIENKECATFKLASGSGLYFGLDWQSCARVAHFVLHAR